MTAAHPAPPPPARRRLARPLLHAALALAFGLQPALALWAANLGDLGPGATQRALGAAAALALLAFAAAALAARHTGRAALAVAGLMLLFYSYGHVYQAVEGWSLGGLALGRHRFLLPAWLAAMAAWAWFSLRRFRRPDAGVVVTAVVAAALLALPLAQLGSAWLAARAPDRAPSGALPAGAPAAGAARPDVYYIILDGYGRQDVLRELYDLDNSSFLAALRERGFYVADHAHSNYSQTSLSLASTLGMEYLDDLAASMPAGSRNLRPLEERIQNSQTVEAFRSLGYRFVAFESAYPMTTIASADIYLAPRYQDLSASASLGVGLQLNEFEILLAQTTALRYPLEVYSQRHASLAAALDFPFQKHRMRILHTFSSLGEIAGWEGSHLVFAHVLAPHPPFVFGPRGEVVPPTGPFTMQDSGCCRREEYIQGYRDQLQYINLLALQAVDEILVRSETPPIIILQGDHGPAAHQDPQDQLSGELRERMAILNAYYAPPEVLAQLHPCVTPVNSFRLILRSVFGFDLDPLPDRVYFSPGGRAYDLHDLTDELLGEACHAAAP